MKKEQNKSSNTTNKQHEVSLHKHTSQKQTTIPQASMAWQQLSTEYLIREPWLTARRDKVKLPTGIVLNDYYVLEYPDWVNTIAITRDGDFVLVRQYRHALGVTSTEICAGVMEKNEEPIEAARRELLEETGYGNGHWVHWMTLAPNPGTMTNRCHCFLATGVEKISSQQLDRTEDIEVLLVSRDTLLQMLKNNELYQAMMYAPLWKYFALETDLPTFDQPKEPNPTKKENR